MKKLLSLNYFCLLLLFLIVTLISFLNFTPHSFLTGWDTLHPEFNFSVNFNRLIHGVWREEQGLGAVAGHSHMADLPRVTLLWLEHFFLPINFLRYSYIFLCLYLGTFGFYFFAKKIFKEPIIAFLGACLYLFNLGTLQQFLVPFEMFPTQWSILPWVFLITTKLLEARYFNKFFLLLFIFINLFATPQAYAAHLWYAFFLFWLLFCISDYLILRSKLHHIVGLTTLILLINSFWLLPNLYYVFTHSQIPINNLNNQLHTPEFLLANRSTGNLIDTSFLKGFYFNWEIYDFNLKQLVPLTSIWNLHLDNPLFIIFSISLFTLSLLGVLLSFLEKKKEILCLVPIYLVCLNLLLNNTPPFSYLFDSLLNLPVLGEALRFSFSKLSVVTVFTWAIFTTHSLNFLLSHLQRSKKYTIGAICIFLFYYCYPYFRGQLIHPLLKQKIPNFYFQLYDYLNQQPQGRILTLPLFESTGWVYHDWGYQGSGFLSFGLKHSLLDRDFDRWSTQNEQAYHDFFRSLYSQNPYKLYLNLQKYQISYLIWDHSVITTETKNSNSIIFKEQTQELLNNLIQQNKLIAQDNFGSISVYKVNQPPSNPPETEVTPEPTLHSLVKPSNLSPPLYSYSAPYLTTLNPNLSLSPDQKSVQINSLPPHHQGVSISFPNLPHTQSYLLAIQSNNTFGLPLRICLKNTYNQICTLYHQASKFTKPDWDYYYISPLDSESGYELFLDSLVISNFGSKNQLFHVELYLYPPTIETSPSPPPTHTNYYYQSQSYSPDWLAFSVSSNNIHFLTPHLQVNSWANGWQLPDSFNPKTNIYIFFWPQLFQYLGFALALLTIIYVTYSLFRTTPPSS